MLCFRSGNQDVRNNYHFMTLTKEHIAIMEHTRDRAAGGYYCGDSSPMQELVAEGLMASVGRKSFVPEPYFQLTGKGHEALRAGNK